MSLGRWQAAGLALFAVAAAGALLATCVSPRFAFVRQGSEVAWIASPEPPVSTGVVAAPRDALPVVEFATRVQAPEAGPMRLRVRALRGFRLEWNGRVRALRRHDEGSWREEHVVEVPARPGANELRVEVRNPSGPPLLRLEGRGAGTSFGTDERWLARRDDGRALPARRADDRARAAAAIPVPRLGASLAARAGDLLVLLAGSVLVALLARGPAVRPWLARARPWLVGGGLAALWLAVGIRAAGLPAWVGFDGPDHLAHVHWILERGALPRAGDGPQTHHPPLFYAASAALLWLTGGGAESAVLRVLPFASGVVLVGVAGRLAQRLAPARSGRAWLAAAAAGLLPLNLYMACYLTNEPLHAALAALALLATTDLLLRDDAPPARLLLAGALFGLSVLAKVSSLVLLPVALAALALKHRAVDRRPLGEVAGCAVAVAAAFLAVSGWYFVRNLRAFGALVVGNWNVPDAAVAWWQHPGFHTPAYYLRFGSVLERPFYASFESFWDGMYATFWGDGLLAGVAGWSVRHPMWDYEWMAVVYALALPATAVLVLGFAALVRDSFRDAQPDAAVRPGARRVALAYLTGSGAAVCFAALYITFVVPAYSMTKASYALSATPIFALAFAEGLARCRRAVARRPALAVALDAWAGTLAAAVALAFLGGGGS